MADRPRAEILKLADAAIVRHGGQAEVWFKFTCAHCGTRCTFADANTLYEQGECYDCGGMTVVAAAGFMLVLKPLGGGMRTKDCV
jgi:hypothetical protein